jgi:polyisoprenoid-binding protein YceI
MQHRAINFASAAFFITSLALAGETWILDSGTSNARLFQGSIVNPESSNTGVARVTGKVKLDTNDLEGSFFDLSIYPADEDWWRALSPKGAMPTGHLPGATDHTLLTFKSTHILSTGDGKLEVIGDLTLTRVKRTIAATPSEAHAGPVHGDPVIHKETREITFLFPSVSAAYLAEPLTSTKTPQKGVLEIVGSARVEREEFPELLGAIKETSWPPIVQNEDCHKPSTLVNDSNRASCSATPIAATQENDRQALASAGEDYSRPQCTLAVGNQTTIVLDLKFLHTVPEQPVGMLSGNGRTR